MGVRHLIEELVNVVVVYLVRVGQFAGTRGVKQLAGRRDHHRGGNAVLDRIAVALADLQVMVEVADVHFHDYKRFANQLRVLCRVQRCVQRTAVVASVRAENHQGWLVGRLAGRQRLT